MVLDGDFTSLDAGQDDAGILDSGLNLAQESDSLTTVDQTMIVGQGDVHHRANLNLLEGKSRRNFTTKCCQFSPVP